jgi:Zn-dependent metalloprotease
MKKNILLLLVLVLGYVSYAQVFTGSGAAKLIKGSSMIRMKNASDIPDYIKLNPAAVFDKYNTSAWMTSTLQCSPEFQCIMKDGIINKQGETHYRAQQYYNGILVKDAHFILHEKAGKVYAVNGKMYRDINISNNLLLSQEEALSKAMEFVHATLYKWQNPEAELFLKKTSGDPLASYYPKGEIELFPIATEYTTSHVYTWKFDVYAESPLSRKWVYVDASSGQVLFSDDRLKNSDTPGTAMTKYSGTQEIVSDFTGSTYRLRETERGNGIETYNMETGTNYNAAVDFTDEDNVWNNINAQMDEVATDAHWGAEMTYDYFMDKYNRNSIDGNGFKLISYVHYDNQYANAFWDGQVMTYGDGDASWSPLTALDICGHEIGHGLTEHEANLIYSYESGALNEGYSDIFGTAVEFFGKPSLANWLMGDDIGSAIRNVANPNSMNDPDTYHGNHWFTGSGDNGGVHTNSLVLGYWFYLSAMGGTGTNDNGDVYSVASIGIDKAAAVAYRTLTEYLIESSVYEDARFYSILSAKDLFGGCSPEVETVTNAFYAVGIGSPYTPGVHCEFDAATTEFCQVPAEVTFHNTTVNGTDYLWNFGDGTTSTALNPVHTYTTGGTFTVSLYSSDSACGSDTIIKSAFVAVNLITAPVVTSASNCGGPASLTLTAMAADSVEWFTTATGGTSFHTGTSYTTPVLSATQHYYVECQNVLPAINGGKLSNSGGGGNFSGNASHYLEFDCFVPVVLKSVKVYAQGAGDRTVELRDNGGNVLQTATINIPNGESRITLNFNIPVATNLQLASLEAPNLFRNNAGCAYPYTVGNMITITNSSAFTNPTGYYYFFYDWEVQEPACVSQRLQVSAFINYAPPVASFTYLSYAGNHVNFTNTTTDGNEFLWDFGDGTTSTDENPVHIYASPGTYTVSLSVTNSCGNNSTSQSIVTVTTGIVDATSSGVRIYPNPVHDRLIVEMTFENAQQTDLKILDLLGNTAWKKAIAPTLHSQESIDVSALSPGVYFLNVSNGAQTSNYRFVVK